MSRTSWKALPLPLPFEVAEATRALDVDQARHDARRGNSLLVACREIEGEANRGNQIQLLRNELLKLGFDWVALGNVDPASGMARPYAFKAEMAHPRWSQRYFSRGYSSCDSRLIAFAQSNMPYVWNLHRLRRDGMRANASPALLEEFLDGMEADGLRSGVFFGIPDLASNRRCFMSMTSKEADSGWIDGACVGAALTLGMSVGSVLSRLVEPDSRVNKSDARDMSSTQREIVTCLRTGMSDKQIAYALSLSKHNVDYHMRQLRRRYGVRNRVQLAQQLGKADADRQAREVESVRNLESPGASSVLSCLPSLG